MPDYLAPSAVFSTDTPTTMDVGVFAHRELSPDRLASFARTGDGAYTLRTPVQLDNPASAEAPSFRHDWYYRIHASPTPIQLDSVLQDIEIDYEVWNAHYRDLNLTQYLGFDEAGIEIVDPILTLPAVHTQFNEVRYGLLVKTEGDLAYEGDISLVFDTDRLDTAVSLVRIVLWAFEPNWEQGVRERYEWQTDVMQSLQGKQQRYALREFPRKQVEFDHFMTGLTRTRMEALMWDRQSEIWGLPSWPDLSKLVTRARPGDRDLAFATVNRNYSIGSSVVLLGNETIFELGTIIAMTDTGVTLSSPLRNDWPAGAPIYPVLSARLVDDVSFSKVTGRYHKGTIRWQLDEDMDIEPLELPVMHHGYPVLDFMPNWATPRPVTFDRAVQSHDHAPSRPIFEDDWVTPSIQHGFDWFLSTRANLMWFLQLIHARKGRQRAIWLPTYSWDISIAAGISAGDKSITIEKIGFDRYLKQNRQRRDLRLVTKNAREHNFRVTSRISSDDTTETLGLDYTFPDAVEPDNIYYCCFMDLCVLDTDAVEILWKTPNYATSNTNFVSVFDPN